jgi:urease accessory protein
MREGETNEPSAGADPPPLPTASCSWLRSKRPGALALGRLKQCNAKGSNQDAAGPAPEWLLWQIADSAFPTGGFAHSGGLEAAWQQGEVSSLEELSEFIQTQLGQAGQAALPFVNEAFWTPEPISEIDLLCDAFISNHVANRASRAQGRALLLAVEKAFGSARARALRAEIARRQLPSHFAPVFGAMACDLNLGHRQSVRLFLFLHLRALVSSAVRLGAIGPLVAQSMQARLAAHAESIGSKCAGLRISDVAQTAPLLDVWHGAHDRLYSRLFQT